ncbi:MAG TPA: DUF885 domain-containing protein [Thermoplasmata archaeon]|nr:DUF885 domain-containing protein [Thermoplasmata archaeon]
MESASERLAALAANYWEAQLENQPVFATQLGDRRYDDRLADHRPEALARIEGQYREFLGRVQGIPEAELQDADRVTRTAFLVDLEGEVDHLQCHLEQWRVDPLSGPQVGYMNIESFQPVRTAAEARAMAARWRAMGDALDVHVANLRRGLAVGKVAVRAGVEKVIDELRDLAAKPDGEWALLRPLQVPHEDWREEERDEFRDALAGAVRDRVRPAFLRYQEFLERDVLPASRSEGQPGIMHILGGREDYARLIRVYTSLDLSPEAIHETGMKEVARINGEMERLGAKVFGISDRRATLEKLRTDPELYFTTRDEVAAKAESALKRAKAAIPKWFGRLPKADCEVVRMGEHEEKHSTIAYYRQPAADGSRPGRYYINTYAPETRPRYEAEALAYHEAIPGHHLQLAIMQELSDLPAFRRHGGVTAFVEGWSLYTERLSDEMGLYSSDLDRIGMLSYEAWRACRLVVDTGMHALGWTREQAIDFMVDNTALAKNNIVNEVDRYIAWPGQALAYKTGQLEILALRDRARGRLGDAFDIQTFHDAVLENGAVPLEVLRESIARYVAGAS